MSEKMSALVWRNEPPDQPGWWWQNWRGLKRVVQVLRGEDFFAAPFTGGGRLYMVMEYDEWGRPASVCTIGAHNIDAEWAGPIPLPKEAPKFTAAGIKELAGYFKEEAE